MLLLLIPVNKIMKKHKTQLLLEKIIIIFVRKMQLMCNQLLMEWKLMLYPEKLKVDDKLKLNKLTWSNEY